MLGQDKLIPPLAPEAAGIITGSEQILKEYASASSLNARDIKRLIEDVLHNPDFNADDVDTDMLSDIRLAGCQHFAFKEYLDPHGNRLFACPSNGSVSFQPTQLRICEEKFLCPCNLH